MALLSKSSHVLFTVQRLRHRRKFVIIATALPLLIFFLLQSFTNVNLKNQTKSLSDDERLRRISRSCGPLCNVDVNTTAISPSGFTYRRVAMPLTRCKELYLNPYIQWSHGGTPPRKIPSWMLDSFTMNGRATVDMRYKKNVYLGNQGRTVRWTRQMIAEYTEKLRNGTLRGTYSADKTNELARLLQYLGLSGKRVLVLGSEKPWVEVAALAAGAVQTVTLEYGALVAEDERMEALTPSEFSEKYLDGDLEPFDVIIAYSSIEHSGLGRYGDALNPWGDVLAVAMAWCVARPNAKLVLMVPRSTTDSITFNLHRVYGPHRLAFVATNWARIHRDSDNPWGSHSPLFKIHSRSVVFEKMSG